MEWIAQWLVETVHTCMESNAITWLVFAHVNVFLDSKVKDVMKVNHLPNNYIAKCIKRSIVKCKQFDITITHCTFFFINIVIFDNDSIVAQDSIPTTKSNNIQEPLLYTLASLFCISIAVIMALVVRSVKNLKTIIFILGMVAF